MDFSLMSQDKEFQLENYFDGIQSAFLKSDTTQYDLKLERGRLIKVNSRCVW